MAIQEIKGKNGISFKITAFDGYTINKNGEYVQKRKTKTYHPPKDMPIRQARRIAKQMDLDFNEQFSKEQIDGINMTLTELWNWYVKYYAPNNIRESTLKVTSLIINKYILPELGHIKLGNFTTNRITMFLNDCCIVKDPNTNKPIKPIQYHKDSYVIQIYAKLRALFQVAIQQGWIKENPCDNAIRPKRNKSIKKPALETDQIKDILNKVDNFDMYNAVIKFQIYTGMRIGETLALTWDDIDFKNKTINVNKTVSYINKEFKVGPPKTDNSYRQLGLNNTIYDLLIEIKNYQSVRKKELENVWVEHNLIFTSDTGNYIHRNSIGKRLAKVAKNTDYEYITIHSLRHANATLLLLSGVDLKIVSSHLGHYDIQTTADIYVDVLKSQKQKVAQLIEFNLD